MRIPIFLLAVIVSSCHSSNPEPAISKPPADSASTHLDRTGSGLTPGKGGRINTGNTQPEALVSFAKSLIGTPYKYGSTDPVNGFDCSGFITYVFNHFNISVPRSSIDFTDYNTEVEPDRSKPGDIILFTGTDSTVREVGHMGIITAANNHEIEFIHSTSGRANGVTITTLNDYYRGRFVKVIRVF
jgi:cell wall-associated NlpC family hydrolase